MDRLDERERRTAWVALGIMVVFSLATVALGTVWTNVGGGAPGVTGLQARLVPGDDRPLVLLEGAFQGAAGDARLEVEWPDGTFSSCRVEDLSCTEDLAVFTVEPGMFSYGGKFTGAHVLAPGECHGRIEIRLGGTQVHAETLGCE